VPNPAWTKLTPLQRKLEMKRRAIVRRSNRALRKQKLEADAAEGVNHRPGVAFVRSGAE
jgi:hypothetical protein